VVAAGICDLAIGTDTGGSIRIPAAYCGVVGFKPTFGLVPVDGVFSLSPSCDHTGTLTASVAGASALLEVIAQLPRAAAASSAPCTAGVLSAQLADPSVTSEVRYALERGLDALATGGWQLRAIAADWLDELPRWEQVLATIVARDAYEVHREQDTSRYAAGTRALLDYGSQVSPAQYARAQADREQLTAAIDASLDGIDVLAGPTVGYQAPAEDPPFGVGDDNAEGRFTGPYNLGGHPALSIPVPVAGLPVGLQLAGRRDADRALLALAAAAEKILTAVVTASPAQISQAAPASSQRG
jgi:aspartyl-tRNA(Asn)/glutamyl-tRNA(Gln) amidotransferase subunit A